MRGIEDRILPTGARYLKIHHYADEAKDDQWLAKVKQEMSDTPDDFRREILMDDTIHGGTPVYKASYVDSLHCPAAYHRERIPLVPNSIYIGCWDAGATIIPAFGLLQVMSVHGDYQIHQLGEVISEGGESMEDFAPRVLKVLQSDFNPIWADIQHVGDPSIMARNGVTGARAYDEAKKHGITIETMTNAWATRYAAVTWALNRRLDEKTAFFVVNGLTCPISRQGFQGAYKYKESSTGDEVGPGVVLNMPVKNQFSHIHDAIQYGMVKIRRLIDPSGGRVHKS